MTTKAHLTAAERRRRGRDLRKVVPRSSHAEWAPRSDRADPVSLLEMQNKDRLPWLVPVRHGRMMASPFTFYRGGAKIMAADLAHRPATGLLVQACGDAHLSNFGVFASPERQLLFDVNDFDETLPGPWEWDVKRLAASFVVAGRDNGFDDHEIEAVTRRSVEEYRQGMAAFAQMSTLDIWYSHLSIDAVRAAVTRPKDLKRLEKGAAKARSRDSLQALSKLATEVDGQHRIESDPPLLQPLGELPRWADPDELRRTVTVSLDSYRETLADNRKRLLARFHAVDVALKVVGVGSVGTRSFIVLLEGRDRADPLFLQVKEATRSVLEDQLSPTEYRNHGRRVVEGQRLMQAASDIFLGWSESIAGHHYYWRQLRDMKYSADIAAKNPRRMTYYAKACGWTLARAHARSGDPVAISGYLGSGSVFDEAVTEFAVRYADQNDRDYAAFMKAIDSGRIEATAEE